MRGARGALGYVNNFRLDSRWEGAVGLLERAGNADMMCSAYFRNVIIMAKEQACKRVGEIIHELFNSTVNIQRLFIFLNL